MRIKKAIRDYLIEIEVRKYTPKTIRSYRNNLSLFLRFCEKQVGIGETDEISLSVVKQYALFLTESGRKGTYINSLLKTVKSFVQFCYDEENGGFNTRKAFRWVKEDKPVINTFTENQVRMLFRNCQGRALFLCGIPPSLPYCLKQASDAGNYAASRMKTSTMITSS